MSLSSSRFNQVVRHYYLGCETVLLSLCVFFGSCRTPPTSPISFNSVDTNDLIRQISDIDLACETTDWHRSETEPSECLSFVAKIPQKTDFVSDGQRYFLYSEPQTSRFWIRISGGFSGQHIEWRGPFVLEKDPKIHRNITLKPLALD